MRYDECTLKNYEVNLDHYNEEDLTRFDNI